MQKCFIGVYGCSGFGREVMPVVADQSDEASDFGCPPKIYFVDDNPVAEIVNGYKVLSWERFSGLEGNKKVVIAIASSSARRSLHSKILGSSVDVLSVIAHNVVIYDQVQIGEGSVITSGCILTSNISVGACFHANINSYVAHDCVIGDYVTFAPCVKCNGNVIIEDDVYVGTGAIIKQGRPGRPLIIGKSAKIEAGSYVTKSVSPGETVFGYPARKMSLANLRSFAK
jgi:sugar O-acyltransferase (sialic acid O-acetyltransferase NeuD family)